MAECYLQMSRQFVVGNSGAVFEHNFAQNDKRAWMVRNSSGIESDINLPQHFCLLTSFQCSMVVYFSYVMSHFLSTIAVKIRCLLCCALSMRLPLGASDLMCSEKWENNFDSQP